MAKKLPIAVVLLNWNAFEQTIQCIELLQQYNTLPLDIFVVDNGSKDNSVAILSKKYPGVKLLRNVDNLGFAGGNNVALREILLTGEQRSSTQKSFYQYVLLLNTDAGIDESDLLFLINTLDQHVDIGVTGPVIVNKKDKSELLYAGGRDPAFHVNTYQSAQVIINELTLGEPVAVDYVSGTVALIRIAVLQKIGLFDEDYFFSCEMADLCERIKQQGFLCAVTPQAKGWHEMGQAGDRRSTLYLYYILRNRFLFIRKSNKNNWIFLFIFWTGVGTLFMFKALLTGEMGTVRSICLALRDGLLARYGGRNYLFKDDS